MIIISCVNRKLNSLRKENKSTANWKINSEPLFILYCNKKSNDAVIGEDFLSRIRSSPGAGVTWKSRGLSLYAERREALLAILLCQTKSDILFVTHLGRQKRKSCDKLIKLTFTRRNTCANSLAHGSLYPVVKERKTWLTVVILVRFYDPWFGLGCFFSVSHFTLLIS